MISVKNNKAAMHSEAACIYGKFVFLDFMCLFDKFRLVQDVGTHFWHFLIIRLWICSLLLLTIFPTFFQFYLLKSDYFSSNLKKRALSLLLRPILDKNNLVLPKTDVKSQGKARFLRLELKKDQLGYIVHTTITAQSSS